MSFDALGLIGNVLGIIGFFQSNLPNNSPSGAVLRVKVGLEDNSSLNYGGRIAKIQGYDANNAMIGTATPNKDINSGNFADYVLSQSNPGVQSQYVSFIGTKGAICISWITLKNLDGAGDAAWTGDIGYNCGHSWNWGNQVAGRDSDGNAYKPRCTWLDADHSNGIDTAAMKIDFLAYGETLKDTLSQGQSCSKTTFSGNAAEIDGVPGKRKRSMVGRPRPEWMDKRLIVSNHATHNATELCQHEMSYGPDAVGSDGYFCNMNTRELLPLCSYHDVEGCINLDEESQTITKRSLVAKRSADLHYRSYEKVDMYDVD